MRNRLPWHSGQTVFIGRLCFVIGTSRTSRTDVHSTWTMREEPIVMSSMHDHVADKNGVELIRLAKQYEFPTFVKQANLDQTLNPGKLPASIYADPRPGREQFPCDTAASTWLSTLYFTEKRAEFHPKDAD